MKTTIQKISVVIVLSFLAIVTFTLTSCQKEQVARSAQSDQALNSNSNSENAQADATYTYLLGVPPPARERDTSVGPTGDTLIIEGSGTLSVAANTVTGSGKFFYSNTAGQHTSGTWTALKLLNFTSWGPSTLPGSDPTHEAGKALIRIRTKGGGVQGTEFDALLFIYCVLPGAAVPPGFETGVRVNIPGVAKGGDVPIFLEPVGGKLFLSVNKTYLSFKASYIMHGKQPFPDYMAEFITGLIMKTVLIVDS
jgi:hypothetical protein